MRERDKNVSTMMGKAAKTISFDKYVLIKLEDRAKREGVSVSNLVNGLLRELTIRDEKYHDIMIKHYFMKIAEHKYHKDNIAAFKELESVSVSNINSY